MASTEHPPQKRPRLQDSAGLSARLASITLTRDHLKQLDALFPGPLLLQQFNNAVSGCLVRIDRKATGQIDDLMAQIAGVVKPMETRKLFLPFRRIFVVDLGYFEFDSVAQQMPDQTEYEDWIADMEMQSLPLPSDEFLREKALVLKELLTRSRTNTDEDDAATMEGGKRDADDSGQGEEETEAEDAGAKSGGPRPRFCEDVLLDVLHFLRRTEHAPVSLACRLLQWLSDAACARYPPRLAPQIRLEVRGVRALPVAKERMVANSMRVYLRGGNSYLVGFPAVEPEDIEHLSELTIADFVGPELLQFLRVSTRLMSKCWLFFEDFNNFVRHHSADFISRFFALFPSGANRDIVLRGLSSLAVPLLLDHPTMFDCAKLSIHCLKTFPLDAFQHWLHLDERQPPAEQQKERYLYMLFEEKIHMGHQITSVDHFVQQLRQHFLGAISCCPFIVKIILFGGPHIPELELFVEDNGQTGEQLAFSFSHSQQQDVFVTRCYKVKRGRRESTSQGEGDGQAETEEMDGTMVYIREVMQGDKQPESGV